MMKHFTCRRLMTGCLIVHCSLFIGLNATAQTFTQRLQKTVKGEGTVTVVQSKAIDDLVNGPHVNTAVATTPSSKTSNNTPAPKKATSEKQTNDTKKQAAPQQPDSASQTSDTTQVAKKPERTYKIPGFRIQAYAGGNSRKDRRQAEQVGNELRMLFPTEAIYVHFYSPRWICRMGNYRTYEEAHRALQEVKRLGFTAATIVKGKITVPY